MVDRAGDEIVAFEPRGPFNVPLIVAMTGISSVSLPASADDKHRNKALDLALRDPKVNQAGTRFGREASSPYAIVVFVKEGNEYIPAPRRLTTAWPSSRSAEARLTRSS